mmetsp:Transcript_1351/g.1821  ORF Transcript_1351/g.1821 Transcript_1351/m.1821 type:complete len:118 (+) Transcript_1351:640-993(+)
MLLLYVDIDVDVDIDCASFTASQEATVLSPIKHGSSSTTSTISIILLLLDRVVGILWTGLQSTYLVAVGEKPEDSFVCRMMSATVAVILLYLVISNIIIVLEVQPLQGSKLVVVEGL